MRRSATFTTVLSLFLVAACSGSGGASPTPPPSPSPSTGGDFAIEVLPAEEPAASRMAIPGSGYCFLVVVTDPSGGGAVTITAEATKATVDEILPASLEPGVVGEVWVVADPATSEVTGSVTITGTRDGITHAVTRSLPVFPMPDERAADAQPHFERWVAWLIANHPELGITADTVWEPVFVSTLLVVSHYSYWSDDYELVIAWHNMIPPDDWSDAFMRKRGEETGYTLAWRQDSVAGMTEPHEITPPESLVR